MQMKAKVVTGEQIEDVVNCIKAGDIAVIPTETVYGIAADCLNERAVNKIFKVKERAKDNPINILISDIYMLDSVAKPLSDIEMTLINAFWPGAFTIILDKTDNVPDIVTAGRKTIGVRMPDHELAKSIIRKVGVPLAVPSANISGKPSGTSVEDIKKELEDSIQYIVDDGECSVGLESTVVKVIKNEVVILRPGNVTLEEIQAIGLKAKYDENIFKEPENIETELSPSLKYRHYAPATKCILIDPKDKEDEYIKALEVIQGIKEKKILVICKRENVRKYNESNVVAAIDMGSREDYAQISKNIFHLLRKVDKYNVDLVIIEGVKSEGVGVAIMNRLIRACAYNVIEA